MAVILSDLNRFHNFILDDSVVNLQLSGAVKSTAQCCVMYDSCAQQYAHEYEQFLNLCLLRVRLIFVCFKVLVCIFMCFKVMV